MTGLLPVALALAAVLLAPLPSSAACPEAAQGFARLSTPEAEIAYRWQPDALKVGQFFTMDVIACRAPGSGAVQTIVVDAQMPAHGHGMNYRPDGRRRAGPSRFRVSGLMLHMPGRWRLTVDLVPGRPPHPPDPRHRPEAMRARHRWHPLSRPCRAARARVSGALLRRLGCTSSRRETHRGASRLRHDAHLHPRGTRGDPVARALAAAHAARPQQPRVGHAGRHRARPAAVLRHAPVARRDALLRHLPRSGQVVRRRPRPQPWPRAARPQRHRARQPAPQPLVRLVGRRRQPVGAKPAPDPRRQGIRHDARRMLRDRLAGDAEIAAHLRELFSAQLAADDSPSACSSTWPRRWRPSRRPSSRSAPPSTTSATRSSATTRPAWPAIRRAAQRGLKIFVGKGRCTVCHFGPNFTNGEFDDVGVPYFAEPGRVDSGRHGGIAALRDKPVQPARPLQRRRRRHRAHPPRRAAAPQLGRVPRAVAAQRRAAPRPTCTTAASPTLADVVRHYSEVDSERLHGDDGARIIRALHLTAAGARRPRRLPRNPVERVTYPSSRKPRLSLDYPGAQSHTAPGSRIAMQTSSPG